MVKGSGGKGRSAGEGLVRWRKDGSCEARLLVPKEMRQGLGGRTHLYFYGRTEKETSK